MRYLLDTCVISELVSKQPSPAVVQWVDGIADERTYLSAITVGEIRKGIAKLADSRRKQILEEWLTDELLVRFQARILPINAAVMLIWGELVARLEQRGQTMPAIDSLIAAISLHGELVLVTRNEANFRHAGIEVLNPWELP